MPCFKPLKAFRGRQPGPSGKVPVVFKQEDSCGIGVDLPCGQCVGCRLERSRQWAVRCMHEASLHDFNCFVTLTYNDDKLPRDGSLVKRHFQLFCKRLRKRVGAFRFFHCGEYGEQLARPHYHACIFGYDFPDKVFHSERSGVVLYESPLLEEVWGLGYCTVGALTFESAAYVARYVMKKVTGDASVEHYMRVGLDGEVFQLQPEYVTMSRRPGIARDWFRKWSSEVFPSDECIVRGHPSRPPRYYDKLLEAAEPSVFDFVKRQRSISIGSHAADLTPERLRVREVCAKARVSMLKRGIE